MNQANQKQVVQEANMNLVQIRQFDLDYFSEFFGNFGTQSVLMIGFISGSVSQAPGFDNPTDSPYFFVALYWVSSALTICTGVYALIASVFPQVFGQGLALRGPTGSMVRAIESMIIEQQQIFFSFILTITFFGLQTIGMYWVMFDSTSAIITSIITVIAMGFWYHYSLRVYNRFSLKGSKVDWKEKEDPLEELDDLHPSALKLFPLSNSNSARSASEKESGKDKSAKRIKKGTSDDELHGIDHFVAEKAKLRGGYLTRKGAGIFSDLWERKFFVVWGTLIYYYKDKHTFELDPQKPINRRPIDLEGYTLVAGAVEPPYAISLVPVDPDDIRKTWKFRCDTLNEFNHWVEILTDALSLCETEQSIVKVSDGKSEVLSRAGDLRHALYDDDDDD